MHSLTLGSLEVRGQIGRVQTLGFRDIYKECASAEYRDHVDF